jgi:hypothetical protein
MFVVNELIDAQLGDFLYLAMGECNNHKVIMAVGYTPEYAIKKARQFELVSENKVKFIDISVIRAGEKKKCYTMNSAGELI